MEAFVMIPYDGTFDNVLETAIKPAMAAAGLIPAVVREEVYLGPIFEQIQASINRSKLCLADVTGGNPNVMWEAAYAHALGKPVVFIAQGKPEAIPFDIRHNRCIMYDFSSPASLAELKDSIEQTIRAVLQGEASDLEAIRQIILPKSLNTSSTEFVVASNPLSWRAVAPAAEGFRSQPRTISDYMGIRGLMRAFGLILGMQGLPELVNPDDFDDAVLKHQMQLYLIGSSKANRWTQILMKEFFIHRQSKWRFECDPASENIRNPKVNITVNRGLYTPLQWVEADRVHKDFGIVLRGPSPYDNSQMVTVLAGRSALGTEAASLAVTDPTCAKKLLREIKHHDIDPEDHRQAFLAVVSIERQGRDADFETVIDRFKVCDFVNFQQVP